MMVAWSEVKASELTTNSRLDAEYYELQYIENVKRLNRFTCRTLGGPDGIALVTDGIHASPDVVEENGIRYLSAGCVRDNDFSIAETLWISQDQHASNPRTSLRTGDILLVCVGAMIGDAAVVQPDLLPANSDRHVAIIRSTGKLSFNPYFVSAFLTSKFGRLQSKREIAGNAQPHLYVAKIKNILVPDLTCATAVAEVVKRAYRHRISAASSVDTAEERLNRLLGISQDDLTSSLYYTSRLSELFETGRFGAEFFMPAKAASIKLLNRVSAKTLAYYVDNIKQTWNPGSWTGTLVRNFDLAHAMEPFLDERNAPVEASTIASAKKVLREGDVVISRLRSYLKQIAIVRCGEAVPCVGSSEFIVLRSKGELQPESLVAFLRSLPVQTILKWSQDGTNHPRFDESTLLSIPVPSTIIAAQHDITQDFSHGIAERQEMKKLVRKAKSMIEAEIEDI